MIHPPRIAAWLLAAGLLAGCSGIKTYPDTSPRNPARSEGRDAKSPSGA